MEWFKFCLFLSLQVYVYTQDDERPFIDVMLIKSDIRFRLATTDITGKVINPANVSREAVFDVDIPSTAFISNFSIEIDNETYVGRVYTRVSTESQNIKRRGENAGHVIVKSKEANKFAIAISVAPLSHVFFNLSYKEVLERRHGSYQHDIIIKPRQPVRDLQVHVNIKTVRPIRYVAAPGLFDNTLPVFLEKPNKLVTIDRPSSSSAAIHFSPDIKQQGGLNGLFRVEYDVERDFSGGELYVDRGYFVHFFAPKMSGKGFPRDVLFMLDTSTSMTDKKLGQLKDAMRVILEELGEKDRFNIMQFDAGQTFWSAQLQTVSEGTKSKAMKYVRDLRTKQYTDIYEALVSGLEHLKSQKREAIPMIFFLTDGEPTVNYKNPNAILQKLMRINRGQDKIPIYSLSFGTGADWNFMYRLSYQSGGVSRRIYEDSMAAVQISQFFKEISKASLEDINIEFLNVKVKNSTKTTRKLYLDGSELITVGQLESPSDVNSIALAIGATSSARALNFTIKPTTIVKQQDFGGFTTNHTNVLENIWAILTIKDFLKDAVSLNNMQTSTRLKIEKLSLQNNLVTPVTSMVVYNIPYMWNEYLEDRNELAMRTPRPTIKPRPTSPPRRRYHWGGGGGGGGGWGGGGGDPHFMIGLNSLDYPLCFDVTGNKDDVYTLFQDKNLGLTVNVRFDTGKKANRHGGKRIYIKEVSIIDNEHIVFADKNFIEYKNVKYAWKKDIEIRIRDSWMIINAKKMTMRLVLDSGIEIDVALRVHNKNNKLGDDFINVEIRHEDVASLKATGIIGLFLRKNITIKLVRLNDNDKFVSRLEVVDKANQSFVSRAALVSRPDPMFRDHKQCWMLRAKGLQNIVKPERFLVPDLFDVVYF